MIAALGWGGAVLLLAAYGLVAAGRLGGESAVFHGLNLAGGAALAANSAYHAAWPSVSLNVVWLGIGAWALMRARRARTARRARSTDPAGATRSPA
jgi:hypothetical protein